MNAKFSQDCTQQVIASKVIDAFITSHVVEIGSCESFFGVANLEQKLPVFQEEQHKGMTTLFTVQESERRCIAMDLHDGLGQSLTLIKIELMTATSLAGADKEMEASLQRLKNKVQHALEELRFTVMNLRPPMLDDLGILATLSWFFREFETVCRHIKIEKDFSIQESHIPESLKIVIFRILQEIVSNVVKHAKADRIQLSFRKTGDILYLSAMDNGNGFDPAQTKAIGRHDGTGRGLASIKERVQQSGGVCVIESAVGHGTRINISWACT